jgi:hypothetical protein
LIVTIVADVGSLPTLVVADGFTVEPVLLIVPLFT